MNTINYYYTPQKRELVVFIGNRTVDSYFTTLKELFNL